MDRVPNMGKRRDMSQCVMLARVDDVSRHHHVDAAHAAIYGHNQGVDRVGVERLLKDDSLVPAAVGVSLLLYSWC